MGETIGGTCLGSGSGKALPMYPVHTSGKKVTDVTFAVRSGEIEHLFENGLRFFIEGDVGPYESYRLFDGQRELVV